MASLVAFGLDRRVDVSYFAVILFFTAMGTWWLALYAAHFGYDPLGLVQRQGETCSPGQVAQNAVLRQASQIDLALYGFGLFAVFLFMPDAWTETYAFGRTLTPLLLLLLLVSISKRRWLPALPIAMVTPSILLVYAAHIGSAVVRRH
jgi:hypothetical protein